MPNNRIAYQQNMRKGGGAVGSKAMRKNRGGGKSGRVMGKYKGRGGPPATLATLDLSCILDPVVAGGGNGSEKSYGGEVKWRDDEEEEEEDAREKPFTRKGGLYLSGGRTVTRDSHLLREFHITAVLNAADNVHYSTVEGTSCPPFVFFLFFNRATESQLAMQVCPTAGATTCLSATWMPTPCWPRAMCCGRWSSSKPSWRRDAFSCTVAEASTGRSCCLRECEVAWH